MSPQEEQKQLFHLVREQAFEFGISKPRIPAYITDNIKYDLWAWQRQALELFLTNEIIQERNETLEPTHLMFNMATGTGKTLVMAALILYYYEKGYRHFIFFVNQNNIVDKTENNFINKNHTKYLFRRNIVIDDKTISIRKVDTFDDTDDVQIKFTSIHKLHNAVYMAKENAVTLEDLQKKDLVMIGDEAHHLNASTMKNGQVEFDLPAELAENASENDVEKSWENTIIKKILKKGKARQDEQNKNVLLEFTATIPKNEDVTEKYRTKTIYRFELVDFLKAGYTKEINLVSTSLKKKEKILLALLFNWYRHQIALKVIPNFKPVVLFRSKYIEESRNDYAYFLSLIEELKPSDFRFLENIESSVKEDQPGTFKVYEQGKSRIKQMLQFIKDNHINYGMIVDYIKDEFSQRNCIITNSKDNKAATKEKTTEEQEQLLNSLEDKNNHVRAIFTVKRLTEGWDVLNLFDIVRLYEGRDEHQDKNTKKRKIGEATVQEIQLIGRGVRYFPFVYDNKEKSKRKFDNEMENPLRVLEEFYYHSDDDVKYLEELKRELKHQGFLPDNREIKKFALKDEFKKTNFFKEIKIWKNERIDNPARRKRTLVELENDFVFSYVSRVFAIKEQQVALDKKDDEILAESMQKDSRTIAVRLRDFERHIIAKAINIKATKDLSLLRFDRLQDELHITSIDELISDQFLGNFKINIIAPKDKKDLDSISNDEKLELLLDYFDEFTRRLKEFANPFKGTEEFVPFSFGDLFGGIKEKNVLIDDESKNLETELLRQQWYVLNGFNGTSEERGMLGFLKNKIGNLKEKYEEVYLLRNEEVYAIYDFKQGRGFEPDYLLFLKGNKGNLYYQIYIEAKGGQFADKEGGFRESKEGWKEEFMQQITDKYGSGKMLKAESREYVLIGLPLFNTNQENAFAEVFNKSFDLNTSE